MDYKETNNCLLFTIIITVSPIVSSATLRVIFFLAAMKNLKVMQFDAKMALLYGKLEEEIYMSMPEGFNFENKVLKLLKTLYGLKQAPYNLNELFTD